MKRAVSDSMIRSALGHSFSRSRRLASQACFQIVDRVQVHAQEIADRRIEVARHGQIEHEQSAAAAAADGSGQRVGGQDRLGEPVVEITRSASARAPRANRPTGRAAAPIRSARS
jgi:hypothetical protein